MSDKTWDVGVSAVGVMSINELHVIFGTGPLGLSVMHELVQRGQWRETDRWREPVYVWRWHVPNPPTLAQRQLMTLFFEEIGLGKLMMSIGGWFIPEARETVEMLYEFEKPFVVDHGKYARAFGDHSTPHREAIRQTIAWYRERTRKE